MAGIITSGRGYVFRLWAFRSLSNGELYGLAFSQGTETACIDCTVVNENVTAAVLSNKAEAFGLIEPLYVAGYGIRH
jgi:hypothetical protein